MAPEVDDHKEKRRNERNERTNFDDQLRPAGEKIRHNAANRAKREQRSSAEMEKEGDSVPQR